MFLYTSKTVQKQIFKNFIHICIENLKTLGKNLTKEVQVLYTKIYKTLWRESKQDLNKWKKNPCSWIRKFNIVQMEILP